MSRDAGRSSGVGTRERLLAETRHLLAADEGGDVTLRAITTAAGANVAAVSYHFGSKDELCREVVRAALHEVVDGQLTRYAALAPGAALGDVAHAFVEPVVRGIAGGDADGRALLRIAARAALADPGSPEGAELARGSAVLRGRLRALLPGLSALELTVRVEAGGAIVRSYGIGPLGAILDGLPAEETERLLVAVVVAAWTPSQT